MPTSEAAARIAALRAELAEAEKAEKAEKEAIRQAVTPVYKYTVKPGSPDGWHKVYDDTVTVYEITGECLNQDECKAAGRPETDWRDGGIKYLVNTWNMKFICTVGGGLTFISESHYSGGDDQADDKAFAEITEFIKEHSHGGDITDIVNRFKAERKANQVRWAAERNSRNR